MPTALNTPASGGTTTRRMPRSRATSRAWMPPLPPMAISVRSRGSRPRSTVTARIARDMAALATARMPCAASSSDRPSGFATCARIACFAQAPVDGEPAAGQRARIDQAQHDVGIGHGRPVVAEAVAGRARHGAGRLRPDLQQPALVDARERAAAGADLGDVDRRHLQHVAAGLDEAARRRDAVAELVFRRHAGPAVLDDHGLGGGAAHVEHDEVGLAARGTQARRADHAAGRPRGHHEHRLLAGRLRRQHAAVGGDHADRRGDADRAQPRLQVLQIAAHGDQQIGVHHRRAGALVFLALGQHGVGGRHQQARGSARAGSPRCAARAPDCGSC